MQQCIRIFIAKNAFGAVLKLKTLFSVYGKNITTSRLTHAPTTIK